jgi:hypothetical protein
MNNTPNTAVDVVRQWATSSRTQMTPEQIMQSVVEATGIQPEDISGPRRWQPVVKARHLYWAMLRRQCGMSYPQIGMMVARNHSSVMMAIKKVPTDVLDAMETLATEQATANQQSSVIVTLAADVS